MPQNYTPEFKKKIIRLRLEEGGAQMGQIANRMAIELYYKLKRKLKETKEKRQQEQDCIKSNRDINKR